MAKAVLLQNISLKLSDKLNEVFTPQMASCSTQEWEKVLSQYSGLSAKKKDTVIATHKCAYPYGGGKRKGQICERPAKYEVNGTYYCGNIKEDGSYTQHLKTAQEATERSKRKSRAKASKAQNREYVDKLSKERFQRLLNRQECSLKTAWEGGPIVRWPKDKSLDEPVLVFDPIKMTQVVGVLVGREVKPLSEKAIELCHLHNYKFISADDEADNGDITETDEESENIDGGDDDAEDDDKSQKDDDEEESDEEENQSDAYSMSDDDDEEDFD